MGPLTGPINEQIKSQKHKFLMIHNTFPEILKNNYACIFSLNAHGWTYKRFRTNGKTLKASGVVKWTNPPFF